MQNKEIANNDDYKTREIQAFTFVIINQEDKDRMPQVTLDWCKAEIRERLGVPSNPGNAWRLRAKVWKEFLVNGKFDYTYSGRMFLQLTDVIRELQDRPDTRQAIIQVHNRSIDQQKMGKQRIPCSMFYHFMLRNGKLDVIYNMRSSDFATHFQNDIWLAIELRNYIAASAGYEQGKFFMQVSSLHIYKKDWDLLSNY